MYFKIIIFFLFLIYVIAFAVLCRKSKQGIRLVAANLVVGVFLLAIIKLTSVVSGITMPINCVTVFLSSVFGINGIAAYFLTDFLFL